MFGGATPLAGGAVASDGFAALADLDDNRDGQVDCNDSAFRELRVWGGANADGVSQTGELRTFDALGIASLAVPGQVTSVKNEDNWIGITGSYDTVDGKEHGAAVHTVRPSQSGARWQAIYCH